MSRRRRLQLVIGVVVVLVVALGVGAVLWRHEEAFVEASALCEASRRAPTLRERAQLLDRAAPYRRRIGVFGDDSVYCQDAEWDLERLLGGRPGQAPRPLPQGVDLATRSLAGSDAPPDRPTCVHFPLRERPCRCGDDRYPEDWSSTGLAECGPDGLRAADEGP
jgi:hypothetical protein